MASSGKNDSGTGDSGAGDHGYANKSFVLEAVNRVKFEDRPVPSVASTTTTALDKDEAAHSVVVQVNFTGICGSDIHYWQHGRIGHFVVEAPLVLGHESAGTVVEVGARVTALRPGDRVALEPGVPCRRCTRCKEGRYNLCADMAFAATPPYDGTLAKYYVLPADLCYRLPASVSLAEGALMEPLAVAVHIVRQAARMRTGDSVVVFGAGPVGLLCCAVARQLGGASTVIAVDVQRARLDFALGFAATGVYEAERVPAEETARGIRQRFDLGAGADVAIDATGAEPCIRAAVHVVRAGGSFVQAGMGARDDVAFPIMAVCTKELKVSGSFRYGPGDYAAAIDLVASGRVDVRPLITRTVAFEQAEQAFSDVRDGKAIKVLIEGPK